MNIVPATDLPKDIFAVKVSESLLAQAVRIYLSNQRSSSAHTKTRGQVQGSTRKLFKQKALVGHVMVVSEPLFLWVEVLLMDQMVLKIIL